jgi:winged helix DNA-binding protein
MIVGRTRIDVEERRARLARRHCLATEAFAQTPLEVADSLVALHATDPASVFLTVAARMREPALAAIERALYEERDLVRILGMRRTMFVLSTEMAAIVQAACTRTVAIQQRKTLVQVLEAADFTDHPARWLEETEQATMCALRARGSATASELTADEPRLRQQLHLAPGKNYEALVNVSSRVLFLIAADGHIVRGRPRGSWISSQYEWWPIDAWLPGGMQDWETDGARVELVRRWLARFGPGTLADIRWWTGWSATDVKRALAAIAPVEVDLDGESGCVLADDLDATRPVQPWAALLPGLDPTVMGWAGRDWFLGDHRAALFDTNGNAGPTVWWDGRVVGGWAQRKDGEIAFRLLEDVGHDATQAIASKAEWLGAWIGSIRVTPRFRTPLEKDLLR